METALDEQAPSPAGFWIRFAAVLIDSAVFLAVEFVMGVSAVLVWGLDIAESRTFRATVATFMFVFTGVYYVVLHAAFGQTVGKMVARIRVERLDGRGLDPSTAIVRYAGYFLSGVILLAGYLMAGVRHDRRALHDLLAGTRVVRLRATA